MIDFHSHIIYDIDDGSRNIEESLEMIENAKKEGSKYICATSHYMVGTYEPEREDYIKKIKSLMERVEGIDIAEGLEVYIDPSLPTLYKNEKIWGINKGKYMLIEFPMREIPKYSKDILYEMTVLNLTPIIAHPERNSKFLKDISLLEEFIEEGYLLQMNASSLIGFHGDEVRNFAETLVKRNMVHMLGSDGHNVKRRNTNIKEGFLRIKELNPELYNWIKENQHNIFNGQDVMPLEIREEEKKKKGLFSFLRGK
ncbi:tyrosine-protein phosphatase [Clostridium sp.]|uniref:tyrosine-protein phosphatase n=1 Tax=Clostridium sp. TaxID=1506 RepID=UPI003464CC59